MVWCVTDTLSDGINYHAIFSPPQVRPIRVRQLCIYLPSQSLSRADLYSSKCLWYITRELPGSSAHTTIPAMKQDWLEYTISETVVWAAPVQCSGWRQLVSVVGSTRKLIRRSTTKTPIHLTSMIQLISLGALSLHLTRAIISRCVFPGRELGTNIGGRPVQSFVSLGIHPAPRKFLWPNRKCTAPFLLDTTCPSQARTLSTRSSTMHMITRHYSTSRVESRMLSMREPLFGCRRVQGHIYCSTPAPNDRLHLTATVVDQNLTKFALPIVKLLTDPHNGRHKSRFRRQDKVLNHQRTMQSAAF